MNERIKTPTTFEEQVEILRQRNVDIGDETEAIEILQRISYYRLSAYLLTYKQPDGMYSDGASVQNAYSLYRFDQGLRNLLMPILENIEIAFRTHIAYLIAHKYGALGYREPKNFRNDRFHQEMLSGFEAEIERSQELFVSHHKDKYAGVFPVWVIIELASFGALSRIYSNLHQCDQDEIGRTYYSAKGLFVRTWLRALANLRNICAHYGRLYNRPLRVTPKLYAADKKKLLADNTLFPHVLVMGRLTRDKAEWGHFVTRLNALLEQWEVADPRYIGFPADWEQVLRGI